MFIYWFIKSESIVYYKLLVFQETFITYVCTIDTHYRSHRDNMCFVFTEFIVILQDCTISFSLWWTMVKMAIYTQKCEQKWLEINNREVGIKTSCVEKKLKNQQSRGTIIRDSRVGLLHLRDCKGGCLCRRLCAWIL